MRNTPIVRLDGTAVPVMRPNIDTDALAPSRVRMSVGAADTSYALFREWRDADPQFVLNRPERQGAVFMIGLENFGCGSSRETAVWALRDSGFQCVVAPSFGEIFQNNCIRNGIVPVRLPREAVVALGQASENDPALSLHLDMEAGKLTTVEGFREGFDLEPRARQMLMKGLDEVGLALMHRPAIDAFRARQREATPWVYNLGRDGYDVQQ